MSRACTAGITLNLHNTSDRVVGLLFLDVLRAYAVRQRPHHISRIIELSHCAIGTLESGDCRATSLRVCVASDRCIVRILSKCIEFSS